MNDQHGHKHSHHDHHHHHPHSHSHTVFKSYATAFFANLGFALIELVGGFLTNSLAVMADAVHDFGDALSIAIAWGLEVFSHRHRDDSFHYGYRRFSLLAALISAIVISCGSVAIGWHAIEALLNPIEQKEPLAIGMAALAFLGIAVNGYAAWRLKAGSSQSEKVLSWHLVEDLLGWVIVLIGSIVMKLTGWKWIDAALALGLAIFILWNVLRNLKETLYLLLQGRPRQFSTQGFRAEVLAINGIAEIDGLRVWSLDGERTVLSARLHLHSAEDKTEIEALKSKVRHVAQHHFGASDVTLETCLVGDECMKENEGD